MSRKEKVTAFKIILAILVIVLLVAVIGYLFPVMKELTTLEGQVEFKQKVEESGIYGILALFGLQVAQIFLVILPGEPIEILAGMCYGGLCGTIFIIISAACISIMIFWLVRKLGTKFVYEFCEEEKIKKIENSKLFKNPKKIEMIVFILFLIPGTPKDLLVYVSALLPIKLSRFILISSVARIPSIITSTLAGQNLAIGDWKMSIILYVGILVLVGIVVYFINKFDKDKITKDAIDSIK